MALDYTKIAEKWQKKWNDARVYEPTPDPKRKGFYIQPAYPYPSGAMHIGHARTYTIADVLARYKRMSGMNALFPMGWHVSGTPVIATVELLKAGDEKTIKKMTENFKIPKEHIKELKTPHGFVNYFVDKAKTGYKAGFKKLGLGIDWRRELTTMDKQYNKFIEWQYRILYNKGYIGKGKYPIRYCPHDKNAVGDHDLVEGEGVGINEMTLLKFRFEYNGEELFLAAATLRPETVYGQTNIWVDAETKYAIIEIKLAAEDKDNGKMKKEKWVVSEEAAVKLDCQKGKVKVVGHVKGKELLGKLVEAPGIGRKIPVLPSYFCNPAIGSGIVTSVPSDAPDDWMGLKDLQESDEEIEKYGLNKELVRAIEVIPIVKTPNYGDLAAVKVCEEMKIQNQHEREKLDKAKKIVYKEGYHLGVMNENCGKYAGMKVENAKDKIKKEMISAGKADLFFEMEGKAVCRCGTQVVVSVLDDQWFVKYSDENWKKEAMKTLAKMDTLPELYKQQYENVFEWLEDKPCTRAKGLGTKFPWDTSKIVEPLGDSTIYMAYFTISHLIKDVPAEKLDDSVFDYIMLGKGKADAIAKKQGLSLELLKELRTNFDYWYPLSYNASAIELIPNHMSFSIFQHVAIFPPEKRQSGTLNLGMLIIDGQKMASSKGNVVLIDTIADKLGPDMVRFFLMNFNEPWQELDWKSQEVEKGLKTLHGFMDWAFRECEKSKDAKDFSPKELKGADRWLYHKFNSRINTYLESMPTVHFRRAIQEISFGLMQDLKWHERRSSGDTERNRSLYKYILENWVKAMAPFMPHICEELWERLGNEGFVINQHLPNKKKVDDSLDLGEDLIKNVISDIETIKKLSRVNKPKKIVIYTSPEWKWDALALVLKACPARADFSAAMKAVMQNAEIRKKGKAVEGFVKGAVKKLDEYREAKRINDFEVLYGAQDFMQTELGTELIIENAETASFDPAGKAKNAFPLKPAIYVE